MNASAPTILDELSGTMGQGPSASLRINQHFLWKFEFNRVKIRAVKQERIPDKPIPLSLVEQGILRVIGEGKFSAREIFAEIKKLRGEFIPPFLTIADVNKALSALRSEGFLQSEESFSLTEEAKPNSPKMLEQRHAIEAPKHIERALIPTREHVSRRETKRVGKFEESGATERQTDGDSDPKDMVTKLIANKIDEAVELMLQVDKEGLFLFREGGDEIFLLSNRRIAVRSKGKVKEMLEIAQAKDKFGYDRLSSGIKSASSRI